MSVLSEVLVYLRKENILSKAAFKCCVLEHFGYADQGIVKYELVNNTLILEAAHSNSISSASVSCPLLLKHPPFCPVKVMDSDIRDSIPEAISSRGIGVGIAVLLETSDNCVLLTRRACHMRTFPGVWVPPGGHIELDESLEDAVLRELFEETGLRMKQEKYCSQMLGMWESVFPPTLDLGPPKRHHIVLYMHLHVELPVAEVQTKLKLNPEEVDASIWLSRNLVNMAVSGKDLESNNHVKVTLVNVEGDHVEGEISAEFLKQKMPSAGLSIDRISTGTWYALYLWLNTKADVSSGNSHL